MKTKPYSQSEEKPMVAGEPTVTYQRTAPTTYRTSYSSKHGYAQEEVEMEAEWHRPFTMEELNRWMDEAEAEIEAGEVMTSEEVFAEMERKYPWLCK